MNNCLECNSPTINPKFCSRSCSAKMNNRKSPKRSVQGLCKTCSTPISTQRLYCNNCVLNIGCRNYPKYLWDNLTYKEVTGRRVYQKNSVIRDKARRKYASSSKLKKCYRCGYDKHYEVCHIKAISSFSENDLVGTINSLDNLIALCPNCHWELDNSLWDINQLLT